MYFVFFTSLLIFLRIRFKTRKKGWKQIRIRFVNRLTKRVYLKSYVWRLFTNAQFYSFSKVSCWLAYSSIITDHKRNTLSFKKMKGGGISTQLNDVIPVFIVWTISLEAAIVLFLILKVTKGSAAPQLLWTSQPCFHSHIEFQNFYISGLNFMHSVHRNNVR